MVSIKEVFDFVDFLASKHQSGNTLTADEKTTLARRANDDFFRRRYGLPEEYQAGMPLPTQAYELTSLIKDDLRSTKKGITVYHQVEGCPIPDDYVHFTAIDSQTTGGCEDDVEFDCGVDIIADDKLSHRLKDALTKPSLRHPIANFESQYIQIWPKEIQAIKLTYLAYPDEPLWAETYDSEDNAIFDADNAVDFIWPKINTNEIARMILGYIGINLQDNDIQQYAEMIKNKGV